MTREHLPNDSVYTWWNYRPGQFEKNHGLRIDLALCSETAAEAIRKVWIDRAAGGEARPSDHAPLVLDLSSD